MCVYVCVRFLPLGRLRGATRRSCSSSSCTPSSCIISISLLPTDSLRTAAFYATEPLDRSSTDVFAGVESIVIRWDRVVSKASWGMLRNARILVLFPIASLPEPTHSPPDLQKRARGREFSGLTVMVMSTCVSLSLWTSVVCASNHRSIGCAPVPALLGRGPWTRCS